MEENPILSDIKVDPGNIELQKQTWNKLVNILNNEVDGPSKTLNQWKGVISEMKTNVRRKAREIFLYKKETGGGPPPKNLSELDEKLYALITPITVEGAQEILEPGMGSSMDITEEEVQQHVVETVNNIPTAVSSASSTKRRKPLKKFHNATDVQTVLNKQVKATEDMAKAITILATAIQQLSEALSGLTNSIHGFTEEMN